MKDFTIRKKITKKEITTHNACSKKKERERILQHSVTAISKLTVTTILLPHMPHMKLSGWDDICY